MMFINYFFASVISFLGLVIGTILVHIAPEEQKPLETKFSIMRKFCLLLIFGFMIFYYYNNLIYSLILVLSLIFLFFTEYKIKDLLEKSFFVYFIFGILFFLSSKNTNLFVIESSLILLYGLPTASLMYKIKKKNFKEIFFHNIVFIGVANILFLFNYHFSFLILK